MKSAINLRYIHIKAGPRSVIRLVHHLFPLAFFPPRCHMTFRVCAPPTTTLTRSRLKIGSVPAALWRGAYMCEEPDSGTSSGIDLEKKHRQWTEIRPTFFRLYHTCKCIAKTIASHTFAPVISKERAALFTHRIRRVIYVQH